ncbi:hypothetical protein Tco_1372992 [Tanacetum coccineum]
MLTLTKRTRASCQKQKRAVTLSESIKLDWKRVEPTIESVLSRALKQERFFAFLHYILDGKEIGAGPDSALQIQTFPSSISEPHSPNHAEVIQQLHDFSKTLKRPVKTSTMDANTPPSEWRLIMNKAFLSCSSISPTTVPLSSSISEVYRGRKEHIKTENPVYRASSASYSIRIKQRRRRNGYRKGTREILLGAKAGGSGVEYSTKGPRTFRRFFFWAVVYLSRDLEVAHFLAP